MPSGKLELDFGGSTSWNAQPPNCSQNLYHQSFSVFLGLTVNLSVHIDAFFTKSASILFCNFSYGGMPRITKLVRSLSTEVVSARSSGNLSRRTTACESFPFQRTFPVALRLRFGSKRRRLPCFFTLIVIVAETASVSSSALSFRFPLIAFKADRFMFTSFHRYSYLDFVRGYLFGSTIKHRPFWYLIIDRRHVKLYRIDQSSRE